MMALFAKLATNLLVGLHTAAAAEALVLGAKGGLDPARLLPILRESAAASRMLDVRGPMMVDERFPPQMKLDLFMKDLHLIQEAARAVGTPIPLTDVSERLYSQALAAGHGGEDLSVVVRALAQSRPA